MIGCRLGPDYQNNESVDAPDWASWPLPQQIEHATEWEQEQAEERARKQTKEQAQAKNQGDKRARERAQERGQKRRQEAQGRSTVHKRWFSSVFL